MKLSKTFSFRGTVAPLTDERAREFIIDSNQMAAKGLRGKDLKRILSDFQASLYLVLAMASGSTLDDLMYIGMVGIIDPERPQVEQAVSQLKSGGVIVKMITGDAEKTAKAIGTSVDASSPHPHLSFQLLV